MIDINGQETTLFSVTRLPDPGYEDEASALFLPKETWSRAIRFAELVFEVKAGGLSPSRAGMRGTLGFEGLPGSGKSTLARVLGQEVAVRSGRPLLLLRVECENLSSHLAGQGPKNVAALFQEIRLKAELLPVVAVFDDVETVTTRRDAILRGGNVVETFQSVTTFFKEIDRLQAGAQKVLLVFTTNHRQAISSALQDRVDMWVPFTYPDARQVVRILKDTASEFEKIDFHGDFSKLANFESLVRWLQREASKNGGKTLFSPRSIRALFSRTVAATGKSNISVDDLYGVLREEVLGKASGKEPIS